MLYALLSSPFAHRQLNDLLMVSLNLKFVSITIRSSEGVNGVTGKHSDIST